MKSLKKTFFGVVFLAVIFFIWAAALPEKLDMTKTRNVQMPADSLYQHISDFENWLSWFPWRDSAMNITVNDSAGPGQRLEWEHEIQGKGYMEMDSLYPDSLIILEIAFIEEAPSLRSDIRLIPKATGETEISWRMYDTTQWEYPLGRVRAFMIQKMAGRNIQKAMDDLSSQLPR